MANTAQFVASDTTTQGAWVGVYGADGTEWAATYTDSPPGYLTGWSESGVSYYEFGGSGSNQTWAQDPGNPSGTRYLPVWYSAGTMTFAFGVGSTTRRVAVYAVDPLSQGRVISLTIKDGDDHTTVLYGPTDHTPPMGVNTGGVWLTFDVTGNVEFLIAQGAGATELPCITGFLFDTPGGGGGGVVFGDWLTAAPPAAVRSQMVPY